MKRYVRLVVNDALVVFVLIYMVLVLFRDLVIVVDWAFVMGGGYRKCFSALHAKVLDLGG